MSSAPPRSQIPSLADVPLVIETPRLRLRPLAATDAEALFAHAKDPEVSRYMSWAPHTSLDDTRTWLAQAADVLAAGTGIDWAIEHADAIVGCIGLTQITWQLAALRYDRAELGYWLATAARGQGLTSEAAIAVMRWGFETFGLHKITVRCFEPNEASRRVIEKAGFRFIGRMEDDVWRDGQWYAHLCYELTASEWTDSTRTLRFTRPT